MSPVETALHAAIEAIDEPRSARMDQRTKPSVKASIEAAADLMGIEASAFVVMSAYALPQRQRTERADQADPLLDLVFAGGGGHALAGRQIFENPCNRMILRSLGG